MKLTNKKFFLLQLVSHLGLIFLVIQGNLIQNFISFFIACFLLLFSSTITYHRLLSHRSWPAPRWFEIFSTLIGIFTFTGSSVVRTLSHRYHHSFADTDKDPHSPRISGIFFTYFPMLKEKKLNPLLVKDLLNDRFHMFVHKHYLNIIIATLVISFLVLGPMWTICLFVAPGAICWMNISLCNIVCHWGQENDPIKHNTLLALATFGEGFHKHHHDHPTDPNFGGSKFDVGFLAIKFILFLDKFYKPGARI